MHRVTELYLMQQKADQLRSDGYNVFVEPSGEVVPHFLSNFRPDIIAIKDDKRLIVEITGRSAAGLDKIAKLQSLVSKQTEWELLVVFVNSAIESGSPTTQTKASIGKWTREIELQNQLGNRSAAFLMAWAGLEAAARYAIGTDLNKPHSPNTLIEKLAQQGLVTPTEASNLRKYAKIRNKLIHGELDLKIPGTANSYLTRIVSKIAA